MLVAFKAGSLYSLAVMFVVGFAHVAVGASRRADVTSTSVLKRKKVEPIQLFHCLQGFPPAGPNYFRWEGGHLKYNRGWVTPSAAQWEEFWRVCDEIDVWSWPPTLGARVIDGLSWKTELRIGLRRMASIGQVVGSPPEFEPKLMRLHRALQALTGWQALEQSAAALRSGDVQAAIAVRNREFRSKYPNFNIAVDNSTTSNIKHILGNTPASLSDCPSEVLEPLRIAATIVELWGGNSVRDFVTIEGERGYRFGADAIVSMLCTHGRFLRSLEDFRRDGISRVKLYVGGECEACRAADLRSFTVDTVPELPLASCTCKRYGCLEMLADRT